MHPETNFTTLDSSLASESYLSMYSNVILMIQTIARINDPKASDPVLYQRAHVNPVPREKVPLTS